MDEGKRTIIIDGKIIDLDKISIEELRKLQDKLENDEKELIEEMDKLLQDNEEV